MAHPITIFTGQWADLSLEDMCKEMSKIGYDGLELACWGDHIEVDKADQAYCDQKLGLLKKYNLSVFAISTHLVGQAVCDRIDERHKQVLPDYIWGNGDPEGVRQRAAEEIIRTGEVAKRLGLNIVNGFTGSPIWHALYAFPPLTPNMIEDGYAEFARRWKPILDEYQKMGIKFGLEVHPTEIAFDTASAERALQALDYHPAFGFNYDASHLGYQGVDYIDFIYRFSERIFHVHIKDVWWASTPRQSGVFGGHLDFGDYRRYWDFCSTGRGNINFGEIIRALNKIGYDGPLSVEWEDSEMDRIFGATEALQLLRKLDYERSTQAFDESFKKDKS